MSQYDLNKFVQEYQATPANVNQAKFRHQEFIYGKEGLKYHKMMK